MNKNFVWAVFMSILAAVLILFAIVGFSAGVGWAAWLWMIAGSIDGIAAISNFTYWAKWRRERKWRR